VSNKIGDTQGNGRKRTPHPISSPEERQAAQTRSHHHCDDSCGQNLLEQKHPA
jgi:hypothetical protein